MRIEDLVLTPHRLGGFLGLPEHPRGVVVFAHGSGSSRLSPRNTFVARELEKSGFATLLLDLLTADEASDRRKAFDIPRLAGRLREAIAFVHQEPRTRALPVGLFGASTGAAAALVAAADAPTDIRAVVSRGGRPDLAGSLLAEVCAPTLLIVGERDEAVLELNRRAMQQMTCTVELQIVPGASHLFEEPGALERVVELAAGWFQRYLTVEEGKNDGLR